MKRIAFILCIVSFIIYNKSKSQDYPRIYGGNFHAIVKDVHETYDNGYIIAGLGQVPYGFSRFSWIIKIDINGNLIWDKKIGDWTHKYYLSGSDVTNDFGLIYSGATTKYAGGYNPLFVKMDACGDIEWCKVLVSDDDNYSTGVINLQDGNYVGMLKYYGDGDQYARISLVKLDQTGEPVWIQRLAQEDSLITNEEGDHLLLTSENNFLVSGRCFYPNMNAYYILTDTLGNNIWDIKWNMITGISFQSTELTVGRFYSIGYCVLPGTNNLPVIFKFDQSGNTLGSYLLMGDTIRGGGRSISKHNDSTLIAGFTWSEYADDNWQSEVVIIDTLGNHIHRRFLLNEPDAPDDIIVTNDGKILVVVSAMVNAYVDIYLWKMNANLEDDTLYTQPLTYDSLCPFEIQSDTMDLDCDLFVNIDELPTREEYESTVKIYPNPARDWVALTLPDVVAEGKVEIAVYDVFGREVETGRGGDKEMEGQGEVPVNRMLVLDVSGYPPGMYVVVVTDRKGRRYTGKVIVR
ncbi:MAG TPA: T9SS type A sorting domain-containing protein [Bacteroidales bacterium]|nr:T9SS type A sorting domain-containing protein [Bacteroidales bacterium]